MFRYPAFSGEDDGKIAVTIYAINLGSSALVLIKCVSPRQCIPERRVERGQRWLDQLEHQDQRPGGQLWLHHQYGVRDRHQDRPGLHEAA